jgi:hypothetical protein
MCRRVLTRRLSIFSLAAVGALAMASLCTTASAALLWTDGFDLSEYTAGSPLGNQTGGAGTFFAGAWQPAGYPAIQYNTEVSSAGLSRPGVTSTGGSAASKRNEACQYGNFCSENRTSRLLTDPWAGLSPPEGTFYVSFLMNLGAYAAVPPPNDPHHKVFEMHYLGLDDAQRQLLFGVSSFVGDVGPDLSLVVHDSSDNSTASADLLIDGGTVHINDLARQGTHLYVLKFELSNSVPDVISAFLDPVGTTEPTPNAQVTVGDFVADRMSSLVQFSYNTNKIGAYDEMRVGTEFGDVAGNTLPFAVPEPTSFALLGFGVFGIVLAARRERS